MDFMDLKSLIRTHCLDGFQIISTMDIANNSDENFAVLILLVGITVNSLSISNSDITK